MAKPLTEYHEVPTERLGAIARGKLLSAVKEASESCIKDAEAVKNDAVLGQVVREFCVGELEAARKQLNNVVEFLAGNVQPLPEAVEVPEFVVEEPVVTEPPAPPKRKRGRPKGSKNFAPPVSSRREPARRRLSAEGREAIIAASRRRWARFRRQQRRNHAA